MDNNMAAALKAAEELIAKRDAEIDQLREEANRDAATIIRLRGELAEAETRNALQQQVIEQLRKQLSTITVETYQRLYPGAT